VLHQHKNRPRLVVRRLPPRSTVYAMCSIGNTLVLEMVCLHTPMFRIHKKQRKFCTQTATQLKRNYCHLERASILFISAHLTVIGEAAASCNYHNMQRPLRGPACIILFSPNAAISIQDPRPCQSRQQVNGCELESQFSKPTVTIGPAISA
jgi:hypothetical protein